MPLPRTSSIHSKKSKSKHKFDAPSAHSIARHEASQSSTSVNKKSSSRSQRRMSAQTLNYQEDNGVILELEIEETTLDSERLYEHLYEELIDNEGVTASRLCSKEDVVINFQEESDSSTICPICQIRLYDCIHSPMNGKEHTADQPIAAEQITQRLISSGSGSVSKSNSNTSIKSAKAGKTSRRKSSEHSRH